MTPEQIEEATEAIMFVHQAIGRLTNTKQTIAECWRNGNYWDHSIAERAGELQRLRNTEGGFQFLEDFQLPPPIL